MVALIGLTPLAAASLRLELAALAVIGLLLIVTLASKRPTAAFTVVVCLVALTPPWFSIDVNSYRVDLSAVLSLAIIVGKLTRGRPRIGKVEIVVLLFATLLIVAPILGSPRYLALQGVEQWVLCLLAGRVVGSHIKHLRGVTIFASTLGVCAVLQERLGFNVSKFPIFNIGSTGNSWSGLQLRAGLVRAELTFGQSIALGGFLCLTLAFAVTSKSLILRMVSVPAIGLGILATQSRAALLSGLLVVFLAVVRTPTLRRPFRIGISVLTVILVAINAADIYRTLFLGGDDPSSEITQGSVYRINLLETLTDVRVFGLARNSSLVGRGPTYSWNSFYSIDDSLLYLCLYMGLGVAVVYAGLLAVSARSFFSSKPSAAGLAILGQIPLILTVAPITQYQSLLWLYAGVGISQVSLAPLRKPKDVDRPLKKRYTFSHPRTAIWIEDRTSNPSPGKALLDPSPVGR